MKICGDTLLLVKSIGLPGIIKGEVLPPPEVFRILQLAELNKSTILFLETLRKSGMHSSLEAKLSQYRKRHRKTADLVTIISGLLEKVGICYTIFKTLKPFPYTPADIDVLLRSNTDLTKTSRILEKRGLKTMHRDLYGLTMFSVDHNLNVDLTTEVAVSGFIYLDKSLLFEHVCQAKVNDSEVHALKPYADLVTIAAHCLYKEQMYTLSDYYTFALTSEYYQKALELADIMHVKFALETALKLTYDITINTFGSNNTLIEKLKNIPKTVNLNAIAEADPLDLPIKYPLHILLRGLSKKVAEDPISRNSLPKALKLSLQPKFISRLLEHIMRKTY